MPLRRSLLRLALALPLLAVAAAPADAQAMFVPNPEMRRAELAAYRAELRKAAEKTVAAWKAAWERDDAKGVAELYQEDAFFVPPNGTPLESSQAIRDHLRGALPTISGTTIEIVDFEGDGSLSYATAKYSYIVTPAGGSPYMEQGMSVFIFRQDGRRLRIRSQVMSSEHPPA